MRILYLSQLIPYPLDAGPKVRIYNVLQQLKAAGHDVTLVAFCRTTDTEANIQHVARLCEAVHTIEMWRSPLKEVWHFARSLWQRIPFLIARDAVADMHKLLRKLIVTQKFDAVHADQLWMAQYALAVADQHSGKLLTVLDQHNAMYLIPQRMASGTSNWLKKGLMAFEAKKMTRYEQAICRQFDHVVWVTDEDRQAVNGQMPAVSHQESVIPICVDLSDKPLLSRSRAVARVTFLGGLHWPPNAEGVIWFVQSVWPQIVTLCPDACLTIIGKNPPAQIANPQSPIPNIHVTGYVDDPSPYLQETAVFIVPLHAGGGMRVKILDAWAWGLPIVSTTIGAEGLAYRDDWDLALADTPETFAQQVVRCLADESLQQTLRQNGRLTIEQQYDWRTVYTAWNQIYNL